MLNLLNFFKKEKIWDFQGGIHPPEMKTQSNGTPLAELPLPHRFIIPLKQHIGHEGEICVSLAIRCCAASRLRLDRAECCLYMRPRRASLTLSLST